MSAPYRMAVPAATHLTVREPDARFLDRPEAPASPTLVDSNIWLDILTQDPTWYEWSVGQLDALGQHADLIINPIIAAEISPQYRTAAEFEHVLGLLPCKREALPWDAAYFAGQAFKAYRTRMGEKRSPLPDFYVGAHATIRGYRLLTRDDARYRTYFPRLNVVSPSYP